MVKILKYKKYIPNITTKHLFILVSVVALLYSSILRLSASEVALAKTYVACINEFILWQLQFSS